MHYDMDNEGVDVSTPGGDCAGRPPGAYVCGCEYAGWGLCGQTTRYMDVDMDTGFGWRLCGQTTRDMSMCMRVLGGDCADRPPEI